MRPSILTLRNHRATRGQHPGLLLQRYACGPTTEQEGSAEKREVLLSAIAASGDPQVRSLYASAYERWIRSLESSHVSTTLQTEGRVIVGLGSESILETGIRLHHTYGLPLLPGSALKGLTSHYCATVLGAQEDRYKQNAEFHKLIFGAMDDSGCVTFHDAWLTPDSHEPLRIDVMTPHHPDWTDGKKAPSDFDSPIPIPFLSVAGKFYIKVQWNGPNCEHSSAWTQRAMEILKLALADWGIGGKTSSGYGRLVDPAIVSTPVKSHATKSVTSSRAIPKAGDRVTAKILAERTKSKGGWKAKHSTSDLEGPIQNSNDVPSECQVGDELALIVALANEKEIAFRFPTAADEARAAKMKKPSDKQDRGRRR